MEQNSGMPLGVPMSGEYRYYGDMNPQPAGALAVAASVLVGLAALGFVLEFVAVLSGAVLQSVLLSWAFLGTLLTAGVVFIVWLWRVRSNVEALAGPQTQRLGKGWAIGCWVCPIVNFWFPYRYVVDVWRASKPSGGGGDGLVLAWWLTFMGAGVVAQFRRSDTDTAAAIGVCVLFVAAAALAVLVIRRITEWQARATA
jgi:hypothetical protein